MLKKVSLFLSTLLIVLASSMFLDVSKTYAKASLSDYDYELVYQSPYPSILDSGGKFNVSLEIKNTGSATWQNTGANIVRLGSGSAYGKLTQKRDYTSEFADISWLSNNRPANIDKPQVKPGETAVFNFNIKAPEASGNYKAYFTPVVDGYKWMKDIGIYWEITVNGQNDTHTKTAQNTTNLIDSIAPSVIKITSKHSNGIINQGSGTLFYNDSKNPLFSDLYVLTNLHVVKKADGVTASYDIKLYPDYQKNNFILLKSNDYKVIKEGADLAWLEIQIPSGVSKEDLIRYAQKTSNIAKNNPEEIRKDKGIYVLGYPENGNLNLEKGDFMGFEIYQNNRFIDASNQLKRGNSGGLAVDSEGKIIGIPTFVRGSVSMILDLNYILG